VRNVAAKRKQSVVHAPALHANAVEASVCSIEEVIAQQSGDWIVMRVTRYGEDRRPVEGQIVARSPVYAEASRLLTDCTMKPDPPGSRYHLFRAQRPLMPGDELRERITELITQGDPPGRWPGLR
jgi:hypothetical protein